MSTNYYHRTNICGCCNRYDEKHIGKSSAGRTFTFQGYPSTYGDPTEEIVSFEDWVDALYRGGKIFDEYGHEIPLTEFLSLVDRKKTEELNHTIYSRKNQPEHASLDCWLDEFGNSFSRNDFS